MQLVSESAQDAFLGKINQICRKFGLNNIMAQIYAILYFSGKPLSLNDMVERLKISKGSASINIRALERYGAVRRIWVKGSRKDYYEAEIDIYKVIFDRVNSMATNRLAEVDDMIQTSYKIIAKAEGGDDAEKARIETFKARLDKLDELYRNVQSILGLFSSGFKDGAGSLKTGG